MTHRLALDTIEPITHDTYRLRFARPSGYDYAPGQATDVALDRDGWRDEARPFTFTSLPDDPFLEFTIKSYPEHDGVTARVADLTPGDHVIIDEPWGAIEDRGPGIFLAGGAGITPFIPILRARALRKGGLDGCRLIFANNTEADVILRGEWDAMDGLDTVYVLSEENEAAADATGQIDAGLVRRNSQPETDLYYLCGPPGMIEALTNVLHDMGVPDTRIVQEAA